MSGILFWEGILGPLADMAQEFAEYIVAPEVSHGHQEGHASLDAFLRLPMLKVKLHADPVLESPTKSELKR